MESVGVFDGDLLIVDRVGYTPWSGCVRMVILAGADPRLSGTAQVQWGTRNVTQVSIPEPGTGRSTDLPRHGAARLEESVSEIARKVRQSVHSCRESVNTASLCPHFIGIKCPLNNGMPVG